MAGQERSGKKIKHQKHCAPRWQILASPRENRLLRSSTKSPAMTRLLSSPRRMREVQDPIIPIVAEMIRQCPGTISLGQGVVHYGPPPQARQQVERFFEDPENHKYKPVEGLPELRDTIVQKLVAENGISSIDQRRVVVTAGGNMGFMNAVLAITDPGDEVILQRPCYFNHEMAVTMAGCTPRLVDTDANYQLRVEAIEAAINSRTRAVVTISPNNPTGAVYPGSALRAVNELCRAHGLYHIHDEAYEYFTYAGARHVSPVGFAESAAHTISLFSLSKAYGFASWRIGYMVIPEALALPVKKIQDTNLICPPVISQWAALGAMQAGAAYCKAHLRGIAEVREIVLAELDPLRSFCIVPPAEGAFYFLLKLDTKLSPMEVVGRLIRRHGVAVIPGTTFGIHETCAVRVAYAALKKETAVAGIQRLVTGLRAVVGHEKRG
jgi:aspartate/methionine/tyrosine aminotransferase